MIAVVKLVDGIATDESKHAICNCLNWDFVNLKKKKRNLKL